MNTEIEIWKDVPGHEGIYQASTFGRVKSLGNKFTKKEKILKQTESKGYLLVTLCKNKKPYRWRVAQLIAVTFLNHVPNGLNDVVDHIDFNRLNNNINNLRIIKFRHNSSRQRLKSCDKIGVHKVVNVKYHATIRINNQIIRLGVFNNEQEAHIAYENAKTEYNVTN